MVLAHYDGMMKVGGKQESQHEPCRSNSATVFEKRSKQMKRIISILSVIGVSLVFASASIAANPSGKYSFTRQGSCIYSTGGFTSDLTPIGIFFDNAYTLSGTRTFNKGGKGTAEATGIVIANGETPSVSTTTQSWDYTYRMAGDKLTAEMVPGSFSGTIDVGPRATQTFTVSGQPETGIISKSVKVNTFSPLAPTVETVTYSNTDVFHRICTFTEVLVYLGPK